MLARPRRLLHRDPTVVVGVDAGTVLCVAADSANVYFSTTAGLWAQCSNVDGANLIQLGGFAMPQCSVDSTNAYGVAYPEDVFGVPIGGAPGLPDYELVGASNDIIGQYALSVAHGVWATVPTLDEVGCSFCAAGNSQGFVAVI